MIIQGCLLGYVLESLAGYRNFVSGAVRNLIVTQSITVYKFIGSQYESSLIERNNRRRLYIDSRRYDELVTWV
jgi:hypothetical protein